MKQKKTELLAPAGNPEGFYGAIHAGADAVYLGGSRFGARAYADNFTEEELIRCIRYAHLLGRRVYLTVNTLVKEKEFQDLYGYLLPYYEAGLDGVIVQDMGVLCFVREHFPGMELHASTQMTLTGSRGARLLGQLGVSRIVPARELSLKEIIKLKRDSGLEIEAFIHGAMCYCYSGQCLFSSILGGRSGNRGRCAQPCRLPYTIMLDGQNIMEGYPLSLKDMCTVEHIPELIKAGIDSFKIEGRMKKPEYTAGVTAIYRKYIDRYLEHPDGPFRVSHEDMQVLSSLYIRSQRHDGYYNKHNGADMITLHSPAYSPVREEMLADIRGRHLNQRISYSINISAVFRQGEAASVRFALGEAAACVTGDVVQKAQKQPVSEENIRKQLCKLGDTVFEAGQVSVTLQEDSFYPLKAINELRRNAVDALEAKIMEARGMCAGRKDMAVPPVISRQGIENETVPPAAVGRALTVSIRTLPQWKAAAELCGAGSGMLFRRFYLEGDLFYHKKQEEYHRLLSQLADRGQVYIALPYILRCQDRREEEYLEELYPLFSLEQISGCMVRSLEGYAYMTEAGYKGPIAGDSSLYLWNREALRFWRDKLESWCLPLELNAAEQRAAAGSMAAEKVVYGRIPMMMAANCVAKTGGRCRRGKEQAAVLKDRYLKEFPVEVNCIHCMNTIYNSLPLSLHTQYEKRIDGYYPRIDLTVENGEETQEIIRFFSQLPKNEAHFPGVQPPYAEYTTGHEKRGVE